MLIFSNSLSSGPNGASRTQLLLLGLAYVLLVSKVTFAKPVGSTTTTPPKNAGISNQATRGKCTNDAPNSDVKAVVAHLSVEVDAMDDYVKVLAKKNVDVTTVTKVIFRALCSEENQNSDRAFLARKQTKGTAGESQTINQQILGFINQIT